MPGPTDAKSRAAARATQEVATKFGELLEKENEDATVLEAITIEINKYAVDALTLLGVEYSPQSVTTVLLIIAGRGPTLAGGGVRWREYQTDLEGSAASLLRLRDAVDEIDDEDEDEAEGEG